MLRTIFSRFLNKLILFTLLIGIIPIVSLGFFVYIESSRALQKKASEYNVEILQQTQHRVEENMKIIDITIVHFLISKLVENAMNQKMSFNTFETVNELKSEMNTLQPAMLGINDIYLINLKYDWFICRGGLLELDELPLMFKTITRSVWEKSSYWTRYTVTENNEDYDDVLSPESVYLVKSYPLNTLQPSGLIIVEVSGYELNKMLSNNNNKLGEVMILDSERNILTHNNGGIYENYDTFAEMFTNELSQNNGTNGYFITKAGKQKIQLSYRKSSYNGWIYVSLMDLAEISRDSEIIKLMTVFISIGVLLIMAVISFLGSKKIYNPIRKLQETVRSAFGTVEPQKAPGDELQYIRERIHTIIKEKARIDHIMENQMEQLKEFLLLKLFQGDLKKEEAAEKLRLHGINISWRWICVLVLQIDSFTGTEYEENDRDLMMFAVNNIVNELVLDERCLKSMLVKQFHVTLLGGNNKSADEFKGFVYSFAEDIQQKVKKHLNLKVSIGISTILTDIADASRAYREAEEALKYRVMLGDEALLRIEDVKPANTSEHAFPLKIEKELIDAVKTADIERSKKLLHCCITEILQSELCHQEYQMRLVTIFTDIMSVVYDAGGVLREFYDREESIFDRMFSLRTADDVELWFYDIILEPVIHLLKEKRDFQYKKISEQITTIIHSEYDTDLSLESCSAMINYSPNYVSKVFRKEVGMSFSEYLLEYRVNIAKSWLADTEMKISDIAEKLKYNNSQNFIRCFRKVEGITPGQFRERHTS